MHNLSDFWPLTWIYFCTELFLLSRRPPPASESPWNDSLFTPCSSAPVLDVCVYVCESVRPLLTQVHIGRLWSLRIWRALVHGIQQLLLHLRHRVTVQALHRHLGCVLVLRVHTVQRLQRQRSEGTVTLKAESQHRAECYLSMWGSMTPAMIFDLQTNTSWGDLESMFNCTTVLV